MSRPAPMKKSNFAPKREARMTWDHYRVLARALRAMPDRDAARAAGEHLGKFFATRSPDFFDVQLWTRMLDGEDF